MSICMRTLLFYDLVFECDKLFLNNTRFRYSTANNQKFMGRIDLQYKNSVAALSLSWDRCQKLQCNPKRMLLFWMSNLSRCIVECADEMLFL